MTRCLFSELSSLPVIVLNWGAGTLPLKINQSLLDGKSMAASVYYAVSVGVHR